jgi:thioredoxin 1
MESLNRETFRETVKKEKTVVIFKTPTCIPCKTVINFFDNAITSDIPFYTIDATEEEVIAAQYSIMKSPTILLFEQGEVVKTHIGFITPPQIEEFLN